MLIPAGACSVFVMQKLGVLKRPPVRVLKPVCLLSSPNLNLSVEDIPLLSQWSLPHIISGCLMPVNLVQYPTSLVVRRAIIGLCAQDLG